MKFFLDQLVRNVEGGGGGAAASAAPPAAPAVAAPASSAPPAADPSGGGAAPAGGAAAPPAVEIYRPEGLPDHLLGVSNNETIDKLKKAFDGYRERDAQNKVPEKIEAYSEFAGEIPETVKPHIETLKADPLFTRMSQWALDNKVPLPLYQGLVTQLLSVSSEMGIMEPPVDFAAEKQALVPAAARHLPAAEQTAARERRMNENFAFVDAAAALGAEKGGLDKQTADFVKAMLGDTAKGHVFLEWARAQKTGGPAPYAMGGNSSAATDAKADISRRAALPENTWGSPKYSQASYDQLQADRKKLYAD